VPVPQSGSFFVRYWLQAVGIPVPASGHILSPAFVSVSAAVVDTLNT
jgi:hypothetical protein